MNRKVVVLVVLVMVLSTAAWVAYAQGGRSVSNIQKWEYHMDPVPGQALPNYDLEPAYRAKLLKENADVMERLLNQRGAEGWELAGLGANFFYFKRPK